jgi:hypothetical protein
MVLQTATEKLEMEILIFCISLDIGGFKFEVQLSSNNRTGTGTAKRFRLKAQGCFNPGVNNSGSSTRNGLRQRTQPRCG